MVNAPEPGEDIIDSRDIIAYINGKESEIDDRNTDIENYEADISELEDDIDALETEMSELDDDEDEDEIFELERDVDSKREEIEEAIREIRYHRGEIAELQEELEPYKALAEECNGYGDWEYGEALILDEYFGEYAQQLAEDIGAVDPDAKWPNNHIDWEAAADELKQDYMSVTFGSYDYLMRC